MRKWGWAGLALVTALAACNRGGDTNEAPSQVVEIRDPHPMVVSGVDTTVVYAPTIFAYMAVDPDQPPSSASEGERVVAFQRALQAADQRLRELGVRVVQISQIPSISGLPPGAPGDGADPRFNGTFGYLLVDAPGRVRRIDGTMEAAALACAAASTFELQLEGC